jgi:tetratricopeptide (TPR) repeat protein
MPTYLISIVFLILMEITSFKHLNAQENTQKLFEEVKEFINQKKYAEALVRSKKIVDLEPDNQVFQLQLAEIYYDLQDYPNAIQHYHKVDKGFRHYWVSHKLAMSYFYNNQNDSASKILLSVLQNEYHKNQNFLIRDLVNYGYEMGIAYSIFKNEKLIHEFFQKYDDQNFYTYCKGRLIRLYNNGGLDLIEQNELKKASELLHRSADLGQDELKLKSKYSKKYRIYREKNLANALDYYLANPPEKIENLRIERNLVTVFKGVDVQFVDKRGFTIKLRDEINWEDTVIYRRNAEICKYFYYYITQGKMLMQFDFRTNDSIMTNLNVNRLANGLIGFIRADAEEAPSFYNSLIDNKYNTFFWVFPVPEIAGYASNFASNFYIESIEGIKQPRGNIQIGCYSDGWANWVHEYFHIIERVMNITQKHVYYEENKSVWPDWFTGTGGEDYYRLVFVNEGYVDEIDRFAKYFNPLCSLKLLKSFHENKMEMIFEDVCVGGKDGVYTIEIESVDYELSCSLKDEYNVWARGHYKFERVGNKYKMQFTVPDERKYTARINLKNERGSYTTIAYFTIN